MPGPPILPAYGFARTGGRAKLQPLPVPCLAVSTFGSASEPQRYVGTRPAFTLLMITRFLLPLVALFVGCARSPNASPPGQPPSSSASNPSGSASNRDGAAAGARPDCEEIARACHGHDDHGGLMKECHLMGHSPSSTQGECTRRKQECLAACGASHGAH